MITEIYPGILTHNLEEYAAKLELVEGSAVTWAQVDIMDGQFVPNITVMPHEIMGITTRLNLEAHLMTYNPERYYSDLTVSGFKRVLLHREVFEDFESCSKALTLARDYFPEVGLAINPDTPLESYGGLPINSLQVMGVHPGASGQAFLDDTYDRIAAIQTQKPQFVLAIDGGVNEDNINRLVSLGVRRFVISSHIFATTNVKFNVQNFIKLVQGGTA